jgi:hypothetical protein
MCLETYTETWTQKTLPYECGIIFLLNRRHYNKHDMLQQFAFLQTEDTG